MVPEIVGSGVVSLNTEYHVFRGNNPLDHFYWHGFGMYRACLML